MILTCACVDSVLYMLPLIASHYNLILKNDDTVCGSLDHIPVLGD